MNPRRNQMARTSSQTPRKSHHAATAALVFKGANLGLFSIVCLVALVLFQTFKGEGAWMFVNLDTVWRGFVPDPSYITAETKTELNDAIAFSALAGTVILPFIDLIACILFSKAAYDDNQLILSIARGSSNWRAAFSSLAVISLPIHALFAISSLSMSLTLSQQYGLQPDSIAEVVRTLLPNLTLVSAINQSFIVCCLAIDRITQNHIVSIGIMSAAFIATCVLQMAQPESIIPVHAGYWFTLCSTRGSVSLALSALLFSTTSSLIAFGVLTTALNMRTRGA